ncbi:hypothetical protein PS9374_07107 [Planomonospora sphaerica]|uniref:Uncharacterized protein n=1 Tax=Planomonospora sphaerica TaxID=161355 RepID=A0A171DQT1_9ACTN|nr:hypothetical protein PS9374_07107 [Planomonospora sphaerica]
MGLLAGGIRLMPPAGSVGVSPGWFSLAYGIAAAPVFLHARRASGRPGQRPGPRPE